MVKKIIRCAALIAAIGVMVMIFMFSAGDAEKSSETSGRVTDMVLTITVKGYKNMTVDERLQIRQQVDPIIRKVAHFSEFAMLGFTLFVFFATFDLKAVMYIVLPSAVSAVYAVSDEIHQIFVDGRGPGVIDVLIDTSGAVFAVAVTFLIYRMLFSNRHKTS